MVELKTKPTRKRVAAFIRGVSGDARPEDCAILVNLMKRATKSERKMWGPSIVGLGTYHYKHDSDRGGDWFQTGFSPRKQALTPYLMAGLGRHDALLRQLGKHKTGKCCLYIKQLSDVDLKMLKELIRQPVQDSELACG